MNPMYTKNNLADSEMELHFDMNTDVKPDSNQTKKILLEYPEINKFPPHWHKFSEICKNSAYEKHLGICFF